MFSSFSCPQRVRLLQCLAATKIAKDRSDVCVCVCVCVCDSFVISKLLSILLCISQTWVCLALSENWSLLMKYFKVTCKKSFKIYSSISPASNRDVRYFSLYLCPNCSGLPCWRHFLNCRSKSKLLQESKNVSKLSFTNVVYLSRCND